MPLEEGTVKSSWTPVMPPVRVEAPGLQGGIKVGIKLSPTATGRTSKPSDIILVDVLPDGSLRPIGTSVEGDRLTTTTGSMVITAAVPDAAAILKSVQAPLWDETKSADPIAKALFRGTKTGTCEGQYFLSDAQGPSDDPFCLQYLPDRNRYRMRYGHWGYTVPTLYSLPDGIEPPARPSAGDPLHAFLVGDRNVHRALTAPGGTFETEYAGAALSSETRVIGTPDVRAG